MKVAFLLLSIAYGAFAFPKDCPNVTVIHDVLNDNWYNGCLGLKKQATVTTAAACEDQCKTDMNCSIWQMTKENCWSGNVVHGCRSAYGNAADEKKFEEFLLAGQRLQHGFIRVTSPANFKTQTLGLLHYPAKIGTEAEKIERCKMNCYSDVTCNVWQFGSDGCYIEHYTSPAKSTTTESAWAKAMIAGETIAHVCPPYVEPFCQAYLGSMANLVQGCQFDWFVGIGIILGLLALGLLACFLCQKTPKVKKTRAVKIEPKAPPRHDAFTKDYPSSEEEEKVYFVPQPTMLTPQQSVVMQQPMMMQQQYQQPMMRQAAPQYMY